MRGLKYISWAGTSGYAIAARSYIRALVDAGVDLTWTPIRHEKRDYESDAAEIRSCPKLAKVCRRPMDYDTVLIHAIPENYPEWIEREKRDGRRVLGYTAWELERIPRHWTAIFNRLDGLIVPCRWNFDVFRASGVKVPIHVVPHLSQFLDSASSGGDGAAALRGRLGDDASRPKNRFIFYTVGYWSNRKAPYLTLEAYLRAFDADDPVLMIVKTGPLDITRWHRDWRDGFLRSHPSPAKAAAEIAAKFRRPAAHLVVADDSLSDAELHALHGMGDCYVSLARTEGWGLGAFEAARLGKPVVTTGYGGQLDFLQPDLSWLVDYEMIAVDEPAWKGFYRSTDRWADPSLSQAASHMRAVFADQAAARERARLLAARIERDFSTKSIVEAFLAALA